MAKRTDLNFISDEMLAAYLDGNATQEETRQILEALKDSPELQELLITSERVDSYLEEGTATYTLLPMTRLAAEGEGNLCDVQCEEYILTKRRIAFDDSQLTEEARSNRWLKEKGTPLHSVGRLLEQKGLSVVRTYQNTIADLMQALTEQADVVVVVNRTKLSDSFQPASSDPNHAVVVLECDERQQRVTLFDPASIHSSDIYSLSCFEEAWKDSCCYLVYVKEKIHSYHPNPIDIDDIDLTPDLLELREAIAGNAHDVWAAARQKDGWSYGPVRDDEKLQHPDLIPYADLPDGEKEYDRLMALHTIKLVKKLGFDLVKHDDTELYRLLIGRLHREEELSHCSRCSAPILKEQVYCSRCGHKIKWDEWLKPLQGENK